MCCLLQIAHCALPFPLLPQVSDAVHMLETMHETHVAHLLPRVAACHEAVEAFAASCLACKVGGRGAMRAGALAAWCTTDSSRGGDDSQCGMT